jgi:hypothetical protein
MILQDSNRIGLEINCGKPNDRVSSCLCIFLQVLLHYFLGIFIDIDSQVLIFYSQWRIREL